MKFKSIFFPLFPKISFKNLVYKGFYKIREKSGHSGIKTKVSPTIYPQKGDILVYLGTIIPYKMKIKYYLKRPESLIPTSLYALINYNSNTVKVYIGESIEPVYWNTENNRAEFPRNEKGDLLKVDEGGNKIKTDKAKKLELETLNGRLDKISGTIKETFKDYQNKNDHASPSPAVLKPLIENALKRGIQQTTFLDYFQGFVDRTFAGERINPKSKKAVKKSVGKGYKTTLEHLKEFNKQWERKLDFETVDIKFHNDFINYLTSSPRNLSANTLGDHTKRIKAVMAEATEMKINHRDNDDFKSKYFIKQSEVADTIYLNEAELKQMQDLDLSDKPVLDNVRDLFLIGACTGLRFQDLEVLKMENIVNGFIRIIQEKTGNPVIIPVNDVVKGIIKKHKSNLPKPMSNPEMNAQLKELGKLMPLLKTKVEVTRTTGGMKVTTIYEKHRLLVTHTMRRSFATNEYLDGTLDSLMIMALTGHKTEKSFLKYIRVTPEEQAIRIQQLWEQRVNRNKLRVA